MGAVAVVRWQILVFHFFGGAGGGNVNTSRLFGKNRAENHKLNV